MSKLTVFANWTRPVETIQGNGYLCDAIYFNDYPSELPKNGLE